MKTLLALALLLTACGQEHEQEIDPAFRPVLELYFALAPDRGHYDQVTSMKIGTPPDGKDGVCRVESDVVGGKKIPGTEQRTITVVPRESLSPVQWETVVMHELGHCLHDLKHVDNPESIMYGESSLTSRFFTHEQVYMATHAMFGEQP